MRRVLAGLFVGALLAGAAWAQIATRHLVWTAPGDDGNVGRATLYDGRYATTRPDTTSQASITAWWSSARTINGFPVPRVAGQADTVLLTQPGGFSADSTYYFVIRAADDASNWSLYSNVAWFRAIDVTPPAAPSSVRIVP